MSAEAILRSLEQAGATAPYRRLKDDQAAAESVWDDASLLLSQICGQPLTARRERDFGAGRPPALVPLASPCYAWAGCGEEGEEPASYRGLVVVKRLARFSGIGSLAGARLVVNDYGSYVRRAVVLGQ